MGEAPLLPTFFVIGAPKAGTTSLNNYLAGHPEIAMTEPKELHLMAGADWRQRAAAYADHFKRKAEIRGDCSPRYSVHPHNPLVSEHIAELVPDARFIYMVRDPVDRTIANYAQTVVHGGQRQPLELAVRPEDPLNYYITGSRYASQLEIYLRRFDQDRFLVIDQADLREHRRRALRRAFAHVGADPDFWDTEFALEYNVRGADNVQLGRIGRRLRGSRLNRLSRQLFPTRARRRALAPVRRALGSGGLDPEATPEFRARLAEALAPEAERLRRLTGQSFESWSV